VARRGVGGLIAGLLDCARFWLGVLWQAQRAAGRGLGDGPRTWHCARRAAGGFFQGHLGAAAIAAVFDFPLVGRNFSGDLVFDELVHRAHSGGTAGLPLGALDHRVRAEQGIEETVLPGSVAVAITVGGVSLAAGVWLADLAALFAVARDADVRFLATITDCFDVLHLANHAADFLTMGLAAAVITAAVAGVVIGPGETWRQQQCENEYDLPHDSLFLNHMTTPRSDTSDHRRIAPHDRIASTATTVFGVKSRSKEKLAGIRYTFPSLRILPLRSR
jgi:hypothetical protein